MVPGAFTIGGEGISTSSQEIFGPECLQAWFVVVYAFLRLFFCSCVAEGVGISSQEFFGPECLLVLFIEVYAVLMFSFCSFVAEGVSMH